MQVSLDTLMEAFVTQDASDLYLSAGSPPCLRFGKDIRPYPSAPLTSDEVMEMIRGLLPEESVAEFESALELNSAISWKGTARMRVNLYRQQQAPGVVLRRIQTKIPTTQELGLPRLYQELVMEKRGLVLVVGPTGAGKSTSLASMIEYRNTHGYGHIVTVEDPVEYLHTPNRCIITQRDVGIDTYSFSIALKNTLRQTPDVIVIGEIRDRETMEQAIVFSETGHLCLATLHSNNANQAIERIINFFPEERHKQILLNLSLNLRAILSQHLVPNVLGGRSLALEVMLNHGLIKNLIMEGRVRDIKNCIENARAEGMQTFDQALLDLYQAGQITEEMALSESDNPANLRLSIKQHEMARLTESMKATATVSSDLKKQF